MAYFQRLVSLAIALCRRRQGWCSVFYSLCLLGLGFSGLAWAAPITQAIKMDYFGYRPGDTKIAIFSVNPGVRVEIRTSNDTVVYTVPDDGGAIQFKGSDPLRSGDTVWWVDFSGLTTPGEYSLYSATLGAQSYPFRIADKVYNAAVLQALKTFYYQRCNTPKEAAYAGNWADAQACHMTDLATGPAAGHTNYGTRDLSGGWHDAGDYNKYVWTAVSGAILTLLQAYEDNPGVFQDGDLNIPESGNGIPDILDEIKWELDWLLKMQLSNGAVLYQMHVDGFAANAPPSADTNVRYYQNPTLESGAVFAGSLTLAARIFATAGMTAYANTLQTAAVNTWGWLQTQGHSKVKVWAAAELWRTDPTLNTARTYVDTYYPNNWQGVYFDLGHYDTYAAIAYMQTPTATASVVANMRANFSAMVNNIFSINDLYRTGMQDWSYHWGSNAMRANYGLMLLVAAKLGTTGNYTAQQCREHAQDFLHFFHGQNPLNMVYLSHMSGLGGEHSSWQFYHAWFGDSFNTYSRDNYIGKPTAVLEPDYPYFKGVDNHGIHDNKTSLYGPPPGFVPGGANKDYSGDGVPPAGASAFDRYYRDWNDQTVWTVRTWEITENSIGYQGPYVALGAYFMSVASTCSVDSDCHDGLYCNGVETCDSGGCVSGVSPCTAGSSCDESTDTCVVDVCNNNGVCEPSEDCNNCPNDCISGGGGGCGNGVCEPGLGEDCLSCAADCRGQQGGNPRNRYCCGDGDGSNPVSCSDARCSAEGYACVEGPVVSYCCGDAACDGAEDSCNCAFDCGVPPLTETTATCTDGVDNDCDNVIDCNDNDCGNEPSCQAPACNHDGVCSPGEDCQSCPDDCAGQTSGKPKKRFCCGDGSPQGPEGDGSVCDGNY